MVGAGSGANICTVPFLDGMIDTSIPATTSTATTTTTTSTATATATTITTTTRITTTYYF